MDTSSADNGASQPSTSSRQPAQERVDFICKVKYGNALPDLPFEPKFLEAPFVSLNRFVEYKPTSLEKSYKYELLTEPDLNVKIDLIDPMTYYFNPMQRIPLHPIDEKLLEDESISQQNSKRSLQHSKVVPWMRKTEYISTEFNRFGVGAERQEAKIGYGIRKKFGNEPTYKDRESQIVAINKTFEDINTHPKKHYSKPGVYAVEELPVLPDFDMWAFPFAQVIFDADPLPLCKEQRKEKLNNAVLRGMMDSEGSQFVGYFSLMDASLKQKLADDEEREDPAAVSRDGPYREGFKYEYQLEREYNWTVRNKASKGYEQENYFFVMRGPAVYYNELESRVRLVRRVKNASTSKSSILVIKYRPTNAKENKAMDHRVRQLLYPFETHEEEEDDDEEEDDENDEERTEGSTATPQPSQASSSNVDTGSTASAKKRKAVSQSDEKEDDESGFEDKEGAGTGGSDSEAVYDSDAEKKNKFSDGGEQRLSEKVEKKESEESEKSEEESEEEEEEDFDAEEMAKEQQKAAPAIDDDDDEDEEETPVKPKKKKAAAASDDDEDEEAPDVEMDEESSRHSSESSGGSSSGSASVDDDGDVGRRPAAAPTTAAAAGSSEEDEEEDSDEGESGSS